MNKANYDLVSVFPLPDGLDTERCCTQKCNMIDSEPLYDGDRLFLSLHNDVTV